jgi:hypothetical protein
MLNDTLCLRAIVITIDSNIDSFMTFRVSLVRLGRLCTHCQHLCGGLARGFPDNPYNLSHEEWVC